MKDVHIIAKISNQDAAQIFPVLCDFKTYPDMCKAVRVVTVEAVGENEILSSWEVNFQSGILKWQERDLIDHEKKEIRFNQVAGDIDHFSGSWRVIDDVESCRVIFEAQFDLGIPTMSDMLDPIAEKAIRENIQSIIQGLFSCNQIEIVN